MPITHTLDDGSTQELYTADELAQIEREKQELAQRVSHLELVSAEKTENIKKLRDMTDQEKQQFSAAELENRRMVEQLQEELERTRNELSEKQKNEIESARNNAIKHYVGDNEEMKAKFLAEYNSVNIEENTPENIAERARKAAILAGVFAGNDSSNPINAYWGEGEAPGSIKMPAGSDKEKEEFLKSEKAQAALAAMGMEDTK